MKKRINVNKKNVTLLMLVVVFFIASAAKLFSKTNFTGNWVINLQKSEFNGAPQYTAPKQLKVSQHTDNIEIERLVIGTSGADSTMKEKLSFDGKPFEMLTADQRTRIYKASWTSEKEGMNLDYSSSSSGNPGEEEYHTTELWTLSTDGQALILEKEVKVVSGYSYKIKAVYVKK